MLTPAQKKKLGEIETEWVAVAIKRTDYTADFSKIGDERWWELWNRSKELEKQREKLLKEANPNAEVVEEAIQA